MSHAEVEQPTTGGGSYIATTARGVASGVAALDANGVVQSVLPGIENTAVGVGALASIGSGAEVNFNTAIGYDALHSFVGHKGGEGAGAEGYNTAIGVKAGQSLTTGSGHVLIGQLAGQALTTGEECVAIGCEALVSQTIANANIAIGFRALNQNISGSPNLSIGYDALERNTTGSYNLGIGRYALRANQTGLHNTAIGHLALEQTTVGNNLAIGSSALQTTTTGEENLGVGNYALQHVTSGAVNTALGHLAGIKLTGASTGNVMIGYEAGPSAEGEISNKLYINNKPSATPLIGGTFNATVASAEIALNAGKIGINGKAPVTLVAESLSTGTVKSTSGAHAYGFETEAQAIAVAKFCEKFSKWAHESGLTA